MRWLILEYIECAGFYVVFRINSQSHRHIDFLCKNGIYLGSVARPEWRSNESTLFTRGSQKYNDGLRLKCTTENWSRIKEAGQQYNDYFGYKGPSIIGELEDAIIPKEMFAL